MFARMFMAINHRPFYEQKFSNDQNHISACAVSYGLALGTSGYADGSNVDCRSDGAINGIF